jgi:exosome complex exonuclease RRP6
MAASSPSLATLLANLEAALVDPTTAASQLPDAADLGFERSLSRPFARNLDKEAERILALVSNVLNWSQGIPNAPPLDGDLIRDGEYRQVIEKVEPLLERADDGIEKHLGIGKGKTGGVGAVGAKSEQELQALQQKSASSKNNKAKLPANLLHDADLARPQLQFPPRLLLPRPSIDTTANEGEEPLWKPLLRRKPHTASSASWLTTELYAPREDRYTVVTNTAPPSYTRYTHPYAPELAALTPPESYFVKPEQPPRPAEDSFEKTPFEWIGDKIGLDKMIKEIQAVGEQGEKELAIDLEHHDYRSWGGITSLMQVSVCFLALYDSCSPSASTAEHKEEGLRDRRPQPRRPRWSRGPQRVLCRPFLDQGEFVRALSYSDRAEWQFYRSSTAPLRTSSGFSAISGFTLSASSTRTTLHTSSVGSI